MNKGRLLFARFGAIWGKRFSESFTDPVQIQVWEEEWSTLIQKLDPELVRKAIDHCRLNLDWPPVMSEFLRICDAMDDSLPDFECAFRMAVDRNFEVPEVQKAFAQLDSWTFRRLDEKESRKMFKEAWNNVLQERRKNNLALPAPAMESENVNKLEDWRAEADKRRRDARKEIEGNVLFGEGLAGSLAGCVGKTKHTN